MSEYIVEVEDAYLREKVIRCRDCISFKPRDEECGGRNWCKRMSFEVIPDGYCAWAEPKVGVRE